jgi:hypothetical protein
MEIISIHRILAFILMFICHQASAFDGGDTIALILGLVLGILVIFACLGCYARKRNGA